MLLLLDGDSARNAPPSIAPSHPQLQHISRCFSPTWPQHPSLPRRPENDRADGWRRLQSRNVVHRLPAQAVQHTSWRAAVEAPRPASTRPRPEEPTPRRRQLYAARTAALCRIPAARSSDAGSRHGWCRVMRRRNVAAQCPLARRGARSLRQKLPLDTGSPVTHSWSPSRPEKETSPT